MSTLSLDPETSPLSGPPEITKPPATPISPVAPKVRYGTVQPAVLIAHRGGAGIGPENSMTAFSRSVECGIRYLETDVRSTADGVAVAFHDATLDRITDGTGKIYDQPWRQVQKTMIHGSDEHPPQLEELLGSFPGVRFMVDLKDRRSLTPLVNALRRTRSGERVCVAGSWDSWLHQVRAAIGPQLSLALGWRTLTTLMVAPTNVRELGVKPKAGRTFAHVPWRLGRVPIMADPTRRTRILNAAQRCGVGVMVWTVDDPNDAAHLLDAGVRGVITDYPDRLQPLWQRRGLGTSPKN